MFHPNADNIRTLFTAFFFPVCTFIHIVAWNERAIRRNAILKLYCQTCEAFLFNVKLKWPI